MNLKVLETEKLSRSPDSCLNLIGNNEKAELFLQICQRLNKVLAYDINTAFSLYKL